MKSKKLALVVTYLGKFPEYFDFFLKTCAANHNIDFLFFCDNPFFYKQSLANIKFIKINIQKFNDLATNKLGVPVALTNGYKLCDLKPMYGKIYEDYLKEYDFWGFCDIDMIFGNIYKIIVENNKLDKYDVISSHGQYLAGPFSIFRNEETINKLYEKSKDWIKTIEINNKYLGFDEASNVMPYLWEGHNIFDYPSEIESMTHILMNKEKCTARVLFDGFIVERLKDKLVWKDGLLLDGAGNEVALFHYIVYKVKLNFSVPRLGNAHSFVFDKNGFYIDTVIGRTFNRILGYRASYVQMAKKAKRKLLLMLSKSQ